MKGTIVISWEDGSSISGSVETPDAATKVASSTVPSSGRVDTLDYSLPLRPFMNANSEGLSGSKKLALLVSHFAKGELDTAVDRTEVIDAWNRMTGLLGGKFNGAHESRAKDSGWIYVPELGKIALLKNWTRALK